MVRMEKPKKLRIERWQDLSPGRQEKIKGFLRGIPDSPIITFTAEDFFAGSDRAIHVARVGNEIAGLVFAQIDSLGGLAHSGVVHPGFRRKGIGGRLFLESLAWMKKRGAAVAELPVSNPRLSYRLRELGFESKWRSRPRLPGTPQTIHFFIPLHERQSWEKLRTLLK
ncbi:MAG: GNAT family N-acetyltransferase [Candidatus Micrarchaeota archaeon]